MNKSFYTLLLFFLSAYSLSAQLTPEQAVAEMGRGINLGNTLEPPTEGGWNNGPAEEEYFDAYLEAGFTNIRIPVRWDQHTANAAPFAVNETWMNRVEEVVDWGLSRGFIITLNGHHEDWLKNDYGNATLRARYDAIWEQIAERFQDKTDRLLFEIINEPFGMTVEEVDDLNERILGIIRETNPTRIVIFGGNMYANAEQLFDAAIPEDDYLIGYYHSYDPWQFSGQGIGTWGTASNYQQMNNKYQAVKDWSVANGIPIHHSEFGAVHSCDYNSRMRIYAHNVEQCIVNGFAFSVWDDGGDFGILRRNNNTWPEVKDILVHYHEDSPNQIFSNFVFDQIDDTASIVVDWNNRATDNGSIIIERATSIANNFVQIAELPADATTYTDLDIAAGITYTYRMYTTRADGTLLHGYPTRIRVTATEQNPFNGGGIEIPGELEIELYDLGGEGIAYHDNEPANLSNGFRVNEGVDIGSIPFGHVLEYVELGEWIEFTVNVTQTGTYSVLAEVASNVSNGAFNIQFFDNNATTNFGIPNTGGWYDFEERAANNTIQLEEGVQQMRLNITGGNSFNLDKLIFTLESSTALEDVDNSKILFNFSPNPTDGLVDVNLSSDLKNGENRLDLWTIAGEKLDTFILDESFSTLDLTNYKSGVYLLRLVNNDINLVRRLVVY
jgi:aryl-phospho-beta-D-glucosidase BglC (GH1 family)